MRFPAGRVSVAVLAARVSQACRGRGKKKHAGQGQTELPDWRFGGHVKLTDGNILSSLASMPASPHTDPIPTLP